MNHQTSFKVLSLCPPKRDFEFARHHWYIQIPFEILRFWHLQHRFMPSKFESRTPWIFPQPPPAQRNPTSAPFPPKKRSFCSPQVWRIFSWTSSWGNPAQCFNIDKWKSYPDILASCFQVKKYTNCSLGGRKAMYKLDFLRIEIVALRLKYPPDLRKSGGNPAWDPEIARAWPWSDWLKWAFVMYETYTLSPRTSKILATISDCPLLFCSVGSSFWRGSYCIVRAFLYYMYLCVGVNFSEWDHFHFCRSPHKRGVCWRLPALPKLF